MPIYEMKPDAIVPLQQTTFAERGVAERGDIQRLLRDNFDAISPDTLVISEEFSSWEDSRRRIDLLGVDREANLVVIELKRDDDGGHMELQALRYAAMVSTLTFARAVHEYQQLIGSTDAEERLLSHLGWTSPNDDRFGQDVKIVLVSPSFSAEITTAVLWLNERDLDIRCIRIRPYQLNDQLLVDIQQIVPLPEAADFQVRLKDKAKAERSARADNGPWTGVWYVNVGESDDSTRDWNNCIRYGFISAGGGERYSRQLDRLKLGAPVVAYQKGRGYVGYGLVTSEAAPLENVHLDDGRSLAEAIPTLSNSHQPPELREHAVGIDWKKTVTIEQAERFENMFANQNVVCKLCHRPTLRRLREVFGVEEDGVAAGQ